MKIAALSLYVFILVSMASCSEANFGAKSSVSNKSPVQESPQIENTPEPEECQEEVVLPDSPTAMKQVFNWRATGPTAAFTQVMATPVVAPLSSGDKIATIVFPAFQNSDYSNAYLYAIDGKTGAQKWVTDFKVVASASAALGDIDGDGENDIVALGIDGKLTALKPDGSVKWVSPVARPAGQWKKYTGGPVVADLEGDGSVEVVVSGGIFNGKDGSLKHSIPDKSAGVIVTDADGKSGLELIANDGIYSAAGALQCSFAVPMIHYGAARLKAADTSATIVGSGLVDGVHKVFGVNGANCQQIFAIDFPGGGGGPFNFSDVDGDGILEFSSAGSKHFVVFKADGSVLWKKDTNDASSGATGATTFDFNGDGKNEIVYNDEDYLRIFDGQTGKVLFENENSSGTLYEYPVIVDVDGDGHANLVVAANDYYTRGNQSAAGIRVLESPLNNWVGTRMIWNQHGYDPLLVGETGQLTGINQDSIYKSWLSSKHLVGYRNNIPRPNKGACEKK